MCLKKLFQRLTLSVLFAAVILSFNACSSDDDNGGGNHPIDQPYNPYVLSLAVQGSEGDFTYYTVPFEDVMNGTLDAVGQGIEQPGYYDFTQIDNTIYSIGGLDDIDMVGIRKNAEEHKLETIGDVAFDQSVSDIKKADDNTLVSVTVNRDSDVIIFHTFDKNSITATSIVNVPVSVFGDFSGNEGPSYSGMEISGDHLFLSYYISQTETFATNHTDTARVAVFSYPSLEFQKVITDTRVGPIGGFNVKGGLIKDEQGNVYAISHSNPANGFSQSTKPSGILKIDKGTSEFDSDYFFDIKAASNGGNTAHIKYLKNGKAFAEINVADRGSQEMWSDSPLRSAFLDLNNRSVTFINGIPEHKGEGRRLVLLHDGKDVYLTVPEDHSIYVYKMNVDTHTAIRGAEVQANFVAGLFKL